MYSKENRFIKWLFISSENPNKVASTIKGFSISAIPIILLLAKYFGIEDVIDGESAKQLTDGIIIFSSAILGAISASLTLVGMLRKIINSFQRKIMGGLFFS